MAGVTPERLRLTTSRKPSYRRAGVKIGTISAPTYLEKHEASVGQLLEIVRDPNIAVAFEYEDGSVAVFSPEDRTEFEGGLLKVIEADGPDRTLGIAPSSDPVGQENTAEPQGDGSASEGGDADAEASKVAGEGASANASDGSAADAGTTEPSQPAAADPAPVDTAPATAAPPKGTGKPKTVKAKP